MDRFFAAVVTDNSRQRIFYVGKSTQATAAALLLNEHAELDGSEARFFEQPGAVALIIGLAEDAVLEWLVGDPVYLNELTGPIVG